MKGYFPSIIPLDGVKTQFLFEKIQACDWDMTLNE